MAGFSLEECVGDAEVVVRAQLEYLLSVDIHCPCTRDGRPGIVFNDPSVEISQEQMP